MSTMTTPAVQTNATEPTTAATLAALTELDQGTLLTVVVRKMGDARGSNGSKVIYGDDQVHVIIWTGFSYRALIARSHKMLNQQLAKGGYIERLARATLEEHEGATIEDVCEALQETREWFRKVLAGDTCGPGAPPLGSVWEPLEIDGVKVRGSRIYNGPDRPEDDRAPVPGTIYVQGVKLGEKVVTPAPNGPWRPNSKPKTLAKNIIKESLPVGLYCQYRLQPERSSGLAVGAAASKAAKAEKIGIDPDALRNLFKIAP
jgi:hypothetical protein